MKKLLAASGLLVLVAGAGVASSASASASTPGRGTAGGSGVSVRVAAHFDFGEGQTPENAAAEPDGGLDVSFSLARQIARVGRDGRIRVLAAMPLPADGGKNTPVLHIAATMGVVRDQDGTLYFLYAAGSPDLTGVWRLRPEGVPERIAALPANSLPNGLALDRRSGELYIADSVLGTIWTVPTTGRTAATAWSTAPELASTGYLGANGLKVHDGAVWVSNTDRGTIVRIPVLPGDRPGHAQIRASGLPTVDDFAFPGAGDEIIAAVNHTDVVVRVDPDGRQTTVLTAADGLENPSSVVIRDGSAYVLDAAYATAQDPNILVARVRDLR